MSFSQFYSQQFFCEKRCAMIIWFWQQIVSSPSHFCCYKFYISVFSSIFHSFPKTDLFIGLKKSFSRSFFGCFSWLGILSISGCFSHAFWLNLITLCIFFNASPWFKACSKFPIWITYSVFSCKLATRFFQFSFFQTKIADRFEFYVNFQGIEYQLQENILHNFLYYNFL